MDRRAFIGSVASSVLAAPLSAFAQAKQARVYRIGVIHQGGPYYVGVDGLKEGLRELGLTEGNDYVLETRDLRGDRNAAEEAARSLEREKVDLIYAEASSVTLAVKRATIGVPIVFAVGSDPIVDGLVESYSKPGGRLTGVHVHSDDLVAKRLEILKAILPGLHRVVTFYDPSNSLAVAGAKSAAAAARQLNVELVEHHVASVEGLRLGMEALKPQEADAFFYINDAMVTSQAQFIIDIARAKRLPTMFFEYDLVKQGALAAYGTSYYEAGRLSAKYVQRVLIGSRPQDMPVELLSIVKLVVNLKTARAIGVTIPQAVLLRSDEVIE